MKSFTFFKNNYIEILVFLFIVLIYGLTLRGFAGNPIPNSKSINTSIPPFETSMERGRYAQIFSLVNDHTFTVNRFTSFLEPDLAWYNGNFFPAFPPGTSVLAVPFYLIGKYFSLSQVFTFATSTVFSLMTGIVILMIGNKLQLSKKSRILSLIIFELGSCVWAYSVTLSAYPISSFLIALGFFVYLVLNDKNNLLLLTLLWFLFSINIFIDYPVLLIMAPILFFSIIKVIKTADYPKLRIKIPLSILYSLIPLFLIAGLFFTYNEIYYHKPFVLTNTYNLAPLKSNGIIKNENNLSDNIFKNKFYEKRFDLNNLYTGTYTLLISGDRGLFFFSPIYIIGIFGIFVLFKKKNQAWEVITFALIANLIIYGAFDDPWGGWSFGPRYLIASLPLFAVCCGIGIDFILSKWNVISKVIISLLLIYSIFVASLGALTSNAVPPSIEAGSLHLYDNFLLNLQFLEQGKISSFIYNTYLKNQINNLLYFQLIFVSSILVSFLTIWLPVKVNRD